MAEYPALPLFTDAYLADTRHLTTAQHGAYLLMLMTAWRTADCCLPDDDNFLARICGMDKRTWAANKSILLAFWDHTSDAKLFQKRLKDERNYVEHKRNKNVEAGKASALKNKERHSTSVITKGQPKHNQPTPTPTLAATQLCAREGFFQQVYDYAGMLFPGLAVANASPIYLWEQAGYDFERHVKPALDAAKAKGIVPRSFSFFTAAIQDGASRKMAAPPQRAKLPGVMTL